LYHYFGGKGFIGQFLLISRRFCPWEPPYWTVFDGWLLILSASACSIRQFFLFDSPFCPWEPLYWTILTIWITVLSVRAALLDSFWWLTPHFVRERLIY